VRLIDPFNPLSPITPQARYRRMGLLTAAVSSLLLFTTPAPTARRLYMSSPPTTTTATMQYPSFSIRVQGAGSREVNGLYAAQDPQRVPAGFQRTCEKMRWPPQATVCVCVFGSCVW
jgi:hypothetical protein